MVTRLRIAAQPVVNSKLQALNKLVLNYDYQHHQAQFLPDNHERFAWHASFHYLKPSSWTTPSAMPYVAATSLIDAYSQLPTRPDLAFNSLWSAINTSYNDLYLAHHTSAGAKLKDKSSIDFSLQRIAQRLHQHIPLGHSQAGIPASISIDDVLRRYIAQAPERNFHFVASFILKGIAVEIHNAAQATPATAIRTILVPSIFSTFKKNFPDLYAYIKNSSGVKYAALCTPAETSSKTDIDYGIPARSKEKSRALVHVTSNKLRQAVLNYQSTATGNFFDDDEHWLSFSVLCLLYSTRNTAVHGNSAARMNSAFANAESVTAASWTFLFGYCYLALIFLCQGLVSLTDLAPLHANAEIAL